MSDLIARAIAQQNAKKQGFVYNSDIGLRRWRASLAKVKSSTNQIVNLNVIGDSVTEGRQADANAANWLAYGYVGKMRGALATKYGDVGEGLVGINQPTSSLRWTFAGTWALGTLYGIAGGYQASNTSGSTATFTFNGTGINIIVARGSATGTFTYAIDGAAAVTLDSNNATTINAFSFAITGLAAGDHTVVITKTNDAKWLYLIGAYPTKGTAGVRVNNCGKSGSKVAEHTPAGPIATSITLFAPALTIIALTLNDFDAQTSVDTYTTSLQTIATAAQTYGDCMFVANGPRGVERTIKQDQYVEAMKSKALANNCAFIDLYNRWGASHDYANTTLGLMDDGAHPNLYGHQDMATAVLRVIDEY